MAEFGQESISFIIFICYVTIIYSRNSFQLQHIARIHFYFIQKQTFPFIERTCKSFIQPKQRRQTFYCNIFFRSRYARLALLHSRLRSCSNLHFQLRQATYAISLKLDTITRIFLRHLLHFLFHFYSNPNIYLHIRIPIMYRTRGFICFRKLFVPGVPAGYTAVGTRMDVQSRRNKIEEDHGFLLSSYLSAIPSHHRNI
jgi:hypothetical protein